MSKDTTDAEKNTNIKDVIQEIEISIRKVKSPTKFWAQIIKDQDNEGFQRLNKDIQQYFSDATFSKTRLSNPVEGKRCVVKKDDRTWHRAVIDKIFVSVHGLLIYCNLVDEVECNSIPSRCVYEAPSWVWNHPIRSACFGLYGIAPARLRADYVEDQVDVVESQSDRWDAASSKYFVDMCKSYSTLRAQIIETDEKNIIWVKLYILDDDSKKILCVNDELLEQQFAAVKSFKKLNSAGESEESGNETKYLSPIQHSELREKLNQLLRENTKDPANLSESDTSDDEAEIELKMSQNGGPRPGSEISSVCEAPHKMFFRDEKQDINSTLVSSASSSYIKLIKEPNFQSHALNTLKQTVEYKSKNILEKFGATGGLLSSVASVTDGGAKGWGKSHHKFAKQENSLNSKGVSVRSIAMQTGIDKLSSSEDENEYGLKSFGTQVNFDEDDGTNYICPSKMKKKVLLAPLQSCSNLQSCENFSLMPKFNSCSLKICNVDIKTPDLNPITQQNIEKEEHTGIGLYTFDADESHRKNEFYKNAPVLNTEEERDISDEECSEEQYDVDSAKMRTDGEKGKKDSPATLKTVFIPDNLHSGSVILIRGTNPPNPISLFCKAPFFHGIQHLLESSYRYKGPRLIQAHVWPAILSDRDVLAIAPRAGGKTMAYLAPIVHMIMRNTQPGNGSKQPIAVVVTADWTDAQNLHEMFETFFFENSNEHNVVAVYGGTPAENLKASQIASGCSVLICTAPSLVRICEAKYMNFSRLKYLVLDDINILAEEFTREIKELMKYRANALLTAAATFKSHKPSQLICMGSQWTEGVHSFNKQFLKHRPLLLISHPLEAAVYGNVQHRVITCFEGQRTDHISHILQHWDDNKHGGICIFVENPDDVARMQEIVKSLGYYCLQAHGNMCQWEIDEVRRQFEDESCHPVLVTTDDIITELDIYSNQMVIHFSFPTNQHNLGVRLSTMQTFFRDKDNLNDCILPSSYFLISMCDCYHASDLIKFLERVGQNSSKDFGMLADFATQNQESTKTLIPLCPVMKSYGRCRDENICYYRHHVIQRDEPNTDPRYIRIPITGHVRLQISHVVDATHYFARILAVKNESDNEVTNYEADHAKIAMDMALYYSQADCKIPMLEDPVPEAVYALARSYDRVCVLRLSTPDIMNKKDVQEWSTARRQVPNNKAIICWTTPGGARKTCVRLVDTGSVRVVRCNELLKIPKKFALIPFQAIEVKVCGVRPMDKDTRWLAQANEFIHKQIYNKELEGNIVSALGHTIWLHPAVVRSKLPLAKCMVTDFNVAQQLVKMKFADKNLEQLDIIKEEFCTTHKNNVLPQNKREISSRRMLLNIKLSTKCRNEIFSSSVALEKNMRAKCGSDDVTTILSDTETRLSHSLKSIREKSESFSSASSTMSSQSSAVFQRQNRAFKGSKLTKPSQNIVTNKFTDVKQKMPDKVEISEKCDLSTKTQQDGNVVSAVDNDNIQELAKMNIDSIIKENTGSLHLLSSLCDKFCDPHLDVINRTKVLYEIHMRAVGAFYDLTEKDMIGLSKVLHNTQSINENRIIIGALLSLTIDQVPVASFVSLSYLVKLGCALPYDVLHLDEKKLQLAEDVFCLCQAIVESIQYNTRVVKDCVTLSDVNEIIFCLEKYLSDNVQHDAKVLDNASTTLHMVRLYRKELTSAHNMDMKNNNNNNSKQPAKSIKTINFGRASVKDCLNYDRFNCIDTDTDESVKRPFTPVTCRFDTATETSTVETDTESNDFYCM